MTDLWDEPEPEWNWDGPVAGEKIVQFGEFQIGSSESIPPGHVHIGPKKKKTLYFGKDPRNKCLCTTAADLLGAEGSYGGIDPDMIAHYHPNCPVKEHAALHWATTVDTSKISEEWNKYAEEFLSKPIKAEDIYQAAQDTTPTAPVTSVNGLTGTVVLGAGDVGALAAKSSPLPKKKTLVDPFTDDSKWVSVGTVTEPIHHVSLEGYIPYYYAGSAGSTAAASGGGGGAGQTITFTISGTTSASVFTSFNPAVSVETGVEAQSDDEVELF